MAYRLEEAAGMPLWCQDEAGPDQTVPYPGAGWQPEGDPSRQAHDDIRNGTAKLLTLFRPATGEVRGKGMTNAPNALLLPWLQDQLTQVLALRAAEAGTLVKLAGTSARQDAYTSAPDPGVGQLGGPQELGDGALVIPARDHAIEHPISGSWLNLAESLQRIMVRRTLAGQYPQTPEEIIGWLQDTMTGWNQVPTPFVWDGKRHERRRRRAHGRRIGGSDAPLCDAQLFAA